MAGHAGDAERLELEAHLSACRRCHEQHGTMLALVKAIKDGEPARLPAEARDAVRESLLNRRAPMAPHLPPRKPWVRRVGAGAAIAAAAAAAVLALSPRGGAYRVIEGDVGVDADVATPAPGASVVSEVADTATVFRAMRGGRVQLGDATVDLVGPTEIAWSAHRRRVDLRRGVVTVDVKHQSGRHWEIGTPRFIVEVVGTRFTVGASGVSTERGVVRVLRPDGSLAARVEAGERWSIEAIAAPAAVAALVPAPAAAPAPVLAPAATSALDVRPVPPKAAAARVADSSSRPRAARPAAAPAANEGLAEARRALARGDAPGARRLLRPLFHLGRDVAAEARVIFAESFLVEGRYADAIDGYRLVVRDFPSTHQSESAEFAIAELEAEHGRPAEALAALRGYLARYPHGRFVREASSRLHELAARAPRDRM